jgi:hypothetical protein
MEQNMKANPKLMEEYDNIFDSEDKIAQAIKVTTEEFTIDEGVVDFKDILVPDPLKKSRKETYLGLAKSVSEMGILQPIHVMITEGYADWVEEGGEGDYDGFRYILLDGFRRIWAGYKNGLTRSNAMIWDFKDKDKGNDLALTLSRILNKNQDNSWGEKWYLYQILEAQSALTPGTLEYLLQLRPGDAMKLKDIMSCDYQDVKDELLSNKKSLDQAYNMLQKYRKEEDVLGREDNTGISDMEQAEGLVEEGGDNLLNDEDIKEILEMEDNFNGDLSDEDFDELMGNNIADERQTVGERHPLDPALRAAVLQRDGYCCQITGRGKGLPANIALSILNVHHKVPVHCGGTDSMDNLITVCLDAHTLIHIIERNMGKLGMSKEQYDALDEEEQRFIRGVMKIARIAVEANKRQGKTREQIKEETKDSVKFKMPGVVQKENIDAVMQSKVV